jgi:hypothetical protein
MFPTQLIDINKMKYLSSIGLMKACDENKIITYINPFEISIDWNKLYATGKHGSCVYIKIGHLVKFARNLINIPFNFILITGDGDETIPQDVLNLNTFNNVINNSKIIKWYSVNGYVDNHQKFELIPIGLNYHCRAFYNNVPIYKQEYMLENIKLNALPFNKRICLCYSNFHFSLHNKFNNSRQQAIQQIPPNLIFYEPSNISIEQTWTNQSKYSFVISPHGNGLDCHRTWEALILGCVVIVKTSPLDNLYTDLPVLIVTEWSDITCELLQNTLLKFENMCFSYNKLTLNYWVDKFKGINNI